LGYFRDYEGMTVAQVHDTISGSGLGSRKRLLIVRGTTANQSELRPYEVMADRYDIQVVGSRRLQVPPGLSYARRSAVSGLLDGVPKARLLYRLLLNRAIGDGNAIVGLDDLVRQADLVEVAETYNRYSLQCARLTRRYGCPLVVVVFENTPFYREEDRRVARAKDEVRRDASAFMARSRQIRDTLVDEGIDERRIRVVYSGVDTEQFAPVRADASRKAALGLEPESLVVMFIGRLVWEKGVDDLLRSFRTLCRSHDERLLQLVIVGDGREKRRLIKMANALGVGQSVRWVPWLPLQYMPSTLSIADVVVIPSKPYPLGQEQETRVLKEAFACGKAVVATACGGTPEMAGDAAVVIPPADHPALSRSLDGLLGDASLRNKLGAAARRRAERFFALEVVSSEMNALYAELLEGGYQRGAS
jgi:glycosyltransferase involved in cell wall biosynthesis